MDDAELLRLYATQGSQAAFSELVGRYYNLVHSAAMRQGDGDFHRAKDAAQLVFANLARNAPSLSRHPALIGWLYTSTYFAVAKLMRAERRRQAREKEAHIMDEISQRSAIEADWDQLRPALDGVMRELSERDRTAILWRFFDAQPLAVIGAKLGINEDTARKRVDRALDKMRASLTKRGVASSTAALALILSTQAVVAAPAGLAESATAAALASAAGAGSSSLTLGQILSTAKSVIGVHGLLWIGGILGLLGIGALAHELQAAQHAQTSLAAATLKYEDQMAHFRSLERSAREADRSQASAAASAAAKPNGSDPFASGRRFLARFPQARALLIDIGITAAARNNAPFFRLENLAPAQIEQFEALLATTWVENLVVSPTSFGAGVSYPTEDQLVQLLGGPMARRYENYVQIQDAYQITDGIADTLGKTGMPLSSNQTDQVAQIVEGRSSYYQSNSPMDKNTVSINAFAASVDWDAVTSQLRSVLSPAQWEAIRGRLLAAQVSGARVRPQSQ